MVSIIINQFYGKTCSIPHQTAASGANRENSIFTASQCPSKLTMRLIIINFFNGGVVDITRNKIWKVSACHCVTVRHNIQLEPWRNAFFETEKVLRVQIVSSNFFSAKFRNKKDFRFMLLGLYGLYLLNNFINI
jgi:hypothetical protein